MGQSHVCWPRACVTRAKSQRGLLRVPWSSSGPNEPKHWVLSLSHPFVLGPGRETRVLGQNLFLVSLCARLGDSHLSLARPLGLEVPPLRLSQLLGLTSDHLDPSPLLPPQLGPVCTGQSFLSPNSQVASVASLSSGCPPGEFLQVPCRRKRDGATQLSAAGSWPRMGWASWSARWGGRCRLEGLFPNGSLGWMDLDL